MKKIIAAVLSVLIMFSLCSCSVSKDEVKKQLPGKWRYQWYASGIDKQCYTYYFFDNKNTVTYVSMSAINEYLKGNYKVTDKGITVTFTNKYKEEYSNVIEYKYDVFSRSIKLVQAGTEFEKISDNYNYDEDELQRQLGLLW